jgi:hypothetical protein
MSDVSNIGPAAKGAPTPGEDKVDGLVVRMLVRAIWMQEWMLANPEGTPEARKAAWKDAREATMEKNLRLYRRAIRALSFSGVTINLSDEVPGEDGNA